MWEAAPAADCLPPLGQDDSQFEVVIAELVVTLRIVEHVQGNLQAVALPEAPRANVGRGMDIVRHGRGKPESVGTPCTPDVHAEITVAIPADVRVGRQNRVTPAQGQIGSVQPGSHDLPRALAALERYVDAALLWIDARPRSDILAVSHLFQCATAGHCRPRTTWPCCPCAEVQRGTGPRWLQTPRSEANMIGPEPAFFPYGTHYYCPPTPLPEDWAGDFKALSEAGYTHVQFRPLWRWHERRRGELAWDDLDRIFDLAAEHKLRVILKPMLENAPDYVFHELDGVRIGFRGAPLTPFAMNSAYYVGGYMPCFDNPDVLAAAEPFLRLLVERYRSHPALWYYDAWNEPRSRPLGQCHCPHSIASYQAWLQSRFGTVENMNTVLHKAWAVFETVIPPSSNADIVEMFLWRQWAAWAVSEQVRFVCDTIRSVDRNTPIAVHSGGCDVARDPVCDSCDDLLNARHADRYGFSLNLAHWPVTPRQHNEAEYQSSWLRRVDPDYWCHELYPNSSDWCRSTDPLTLGRHIWMAIAAGCSGLTFWEYRSVRMGIRANGFGMREIDGSPTPRSQVCDEIAAVLREHGRLLARTHRPPARIALLFSKQSDLLHRLTTIQAWMGNMQGVTPNVDYALKNALRAAHLLYQANGEEIDWVVPGDDLSRVRLLHVTATEIVDAQSADWLRQFVAAGGVLLVECPFANRDEKTWIHPLRPGYGLSELLGCREATREVCGTDPPDLASFDCGHRVEAKGWRTVLEPGTAEPIATWQDGRIAATVNSYGQGKVVTLGVNVSLSFDNTWDGPGSDLFGWLLGEAGLERPFHAQHRQVRLHRRRGDGIEVWFAFNVSDETQALRLPGTPASVWHALNAELVAETQAEFGPGGVLVLELPGRSG